MEDKNVMSNTKKEPMAIHKGYFIRYMRENPDKTNDLVTELGCSTVREAVKKLEDFPGEWFIGGSLLSYNDPDLPVTFRREDFCSGCLLVDKKVPPMENRGLCQEHIDFFAALENEGSA
jgi:hypothetical protein